VPKTKPVCLLRSSFSPQEAEHLKREDEAYSAYFHSGDPAERSTLWQAFAEIHAARPASLVHRMERERGLD
jgi:hypothetical protein